MYIYWLIFLLFSAGGLADGELVVHAHFACRVFDLNCEAVHFFEEVLGFAHLHGGFDLELFLAGGVDLGGGLLVELVDGEVAVGQLHALVDGECATKGFLEVGTDGFYFLVGCHGKLCRIEMVFDVIY